jgi:very-short-patch-repair endonuclease
MRAEKPDNERRPKKQRRFASTDAERALWALLRNRQLAGVRFIQHMAVGRFMVEFVSRERRLAVMIEGGWRSNPAREPFREEALRTRGYRVLRFRNDDVLKRPERVRDAIAAHLESAIDPDK